MEILKIYKSLITESEIQSCVKRFGHELFADELGGKERNTGVEDKYVEDIFDFTNNKYGQETNPEFITALGVLKGCMKQYPEVLVPDKALAYRSIIIPIKYFIDRKQPINLQDGNPYIYKANSKVQSWSEDSYIAATFGNHDQLNEFASKINFKDFVTPESRQHLLKIAMAEDLRLAFVLEYPTNPQEFIFKAKYFKALSMAHHEEEIIRFDNKPIQVNAKFNNSADVFLTGKGLSLMKYLNQAIKEA